jgi:hypothetical protein
VDDIGLAGRQHLLHIVEVIPDVESLGQLGSHQPFSIAHPDDPGVSKATDLTCMLVGDFAAPDDSDANQCLASPLRIKSK